MKNRENSLESEVFPYFFRHSQKIAKCCYTCYHCFILKMDRPLPPSLDWGSSVPGGWRAVPRLNITSDVKSMLIRRTKKKNSKGSHTSIIHYIDKYI